MSIARRGPPIAPTLSMALWNPNALPFSDALTEVDKSASLAGFLIALPTRSENRTPRTKVHTFAR